MVQKRDAKNYNKKEKTNNRKIKNNFKEYIAIAHKRLISQALYIQNEKTPFDKLQQTNCIYRINLINCCDVYIG